jgi:hypothetical protein
MPHALLMVLVEADPRHEEEMNAWYDDEHMAERLSIPGFVSARRWVSATTPHRYLATYELTGLDVFESPAYLAHYGDNQTPWSKRNLGRMKVFRRWTASQIAGPALPAEGAGLFVSCRDCPPALDVEFNRWYDEEHVPLLEGVAGMLRARRFRAASGTPRYLALYDLADPGLPETAAWRRGIETPWSQRLLPQLAGQASFNDRFVAYPKAYTATGPVDLTPR